MTEFTARHLVVSHEDDYLLVGFAEAESGGGSYLILQRAYEFNDQDRAFGMAAVYVERDDQRQSAYGGIDEVILAMTEVRFSFSSDTARALTSDTELSVSIRPSREDLEMIRNGLIEVCNGLVRFSVDRPVADLLDTP